LKHTESKPKVKVFLSLLPLAFVCNTFVMLFCFTDWAWANCGYCIIMVFPVFSLCCSK